MSQDEIVKVEGSNKNYRFGDVEASVVKLSGKYFFKDDTERVVRVKNKSGQLRLYRKESPLIVHVGGGKYVHKDAAIKTEDNVWIGKDNMTMVDGKPVRSTYCTEIDGKAYLLTDSRLVKCHYSKRYILRTKSIPLSPKYYNKENLFAALDQKHNLVETPDGWVKSGDAIRFVDRNGETGYVHRLFISGKATLSVFDKFRDETNPQADRIDFAYAFEADRNDFENYPGMNVLIHKSRIKEIDKIYKNVIELAQREAADKIRTQINKNYSDVGPDENQAKLIAGGYQTWPGKHPIYGNENTPVISKTLKSVGGIGYTFGVEFETSAGILTRAQAASIDVKAVGDRSIGAAEYVTGILHGDDGVDRIKAICDMLANHTLVDDRCGLHIHVGGMDGVSRVQLPLLNRNFAILAIKLGCLIEEDLYRISPPNRKPELYHCHSIMRWKGINKENWEDYLGAYVFGEKESWKDPFCFSDFRYGEQGRTGNNTVGTWCGGRYKWLNLVHTVTRSTHKTCEFRLFAGTTNFEKVYAYLLTSLAFVWLIENKPALIDTGMTLEKMVTAAYSKSPNLVDFLLDFYKTRREKFNRGKIYTRTIPEPYL